MKLSPIALFVYNRPAHTRQTIASLKANELAKDSDLFVFSDAAKSAEAEGAVKEVRDCVRNIDGFKSVTITQQDENQGLARSIIAGVTTLSEEYGRVIVLEDDLHTSPFFLRYMNSALDRYENDDRVMQIAGYMFPAKLQTGDDALFLPFISSWGWATWRRAWRQFDRPVKGYERIFTDSILRRKFDLNGRYKYSKLLRAQLNGKIDSWAIWWYLTVFFQNGISLYPKKTLVRNFGFDGTGVNCTVSEFEQEQLEMAFQVLRFPKIVDVSPEAVTVIDNFPSTRISLASVFTRVMQVLRRQK